MKQLLASRGTERPFLVHVNGGSLTITLPKGSGFSSNEDVYQWRGPEGEMILSTKDVSGFELLTRNKIRGHVREVNGREYEWFRLAISPRLGLKARDYIRFYMTENGVLIEKARKPRVK